MPEIDQNLKTNKQPEVVISEEQLGAHYALYGAVKIPRIYCPRCKSMTFISNGRTVCCDNEARLSKRSIDHQRRMSGGHKNRLLPPVEERAKILLRQGNRCLYCGLLFGTFVVRRGKTQRLNLQWDHVDPFCSSGNNSVKNFVAACNVCNGIKGSIMFSSFAEARAYINRKWEEKGYSTAEDKPCNTELTEMHKVTDDFFLELSKSNPATPSVVNSSKAIKKCLLQSKPRVYTEFEMRNITKLEMLLQIFGISIAEVAKITGYSAPYVSRLLNFDFIGHDVSKFFFKLESVLEKLIALREIGFFEIKTSLLEDVAEMHRSTCGEEEKRQIVKSISKIPIKTFTCMAGTPLVERKEIAGIQGKVAVLAPSAEYIAGAKTRIEATVVGNQLNYNGALVSPSSKVFLPFWEKITNRNRAAIRGNECWWIEIDGRWTSLLEIQAKHGSSDVSQTNTLTAELPHA